MIILVITDYLNLIKLNNRLILYTLKGKKKWKNYWIQSILKFFLNFVSNFSDFYLQTPHKM